MSRIIAAVPTPRSAVWAAMLLAIATAVVLPQSAQAQSCTGCVSTGGQPSEPGGGGSVECLDQPEGAAECTTGSTPRWVSPEGVRWVDWCESSGECQSLMFLDFSEDGMPIQYVDGTPRALNAESWVGSSKTCDGILLRNPAIGQEVARNETTRTLVL